MNAEYFLDRYWWNGKFFLLTRDHNVEITTVGGGYWDFLRKDIKKTIGEIKNHQENVDDCYEL